MRLTSTQSITSVLLQHASNAPVIVTTRWCKEYFAHSSTLTIDSAIAEINGLPLTTDLPGSLLELSLEPAMDLDEAAVEAQKEMVFLNEMGSTELISPHGRVTHHYASFISPSRMGTMHLGRSGGTIPTYPLYKLVMPLSPEEYEALAAISLANGAASKENWFAFSFQHKKVTQEELEDKEVVTN